MPEFGDVLQARRWAHGLTIDDLARGTGASSRAVNNWLQGRSLPSLIHFVRLCKILDLDTLAVCALVHRVAEDQETLPSGRGVSFADKMQNEGSQCRI